MVSARWRVWGLCLAALTQAGWEALGALALHPPSSLAGGARCSPGEPRVPGPLARDPSFWVHGKLPALVPGHVPISAVHLLTRPLAGMGESQEYEPRSSMGTPQKSLGLAE